MIMTMNMFRTLLNVEFEEEGYASCPSDEFDEGCEPPARNGLANLIDQTLEHTDIALLIGRAAGMQSVYNYGSSSKGSGRAMREALGQLCSAADTQLHVYICGGACVRGGVLGTVNRYRINDATWEPAPRMLVPRRLCAGTSCGGQMYVFGGEIEDGHVMSFSTFSMLQHNIQHYSQLATVERFDPFRSVWKYLAPMPTPRAGCAAAASQGLIYVVGGRIHHTVQGTAERYDTNTGRWETLPNVPTPRSGCAATVAMNSLYVVGGKGKDNRILSTVEVFNASVGCWQRIADMHIVRLAGAAAAVKNNIFVVGGFDGHEGTNCVEMYDPEVGVWAIQPSMTTRRIGAAAVNANGKLYVLGGKAEEDLPLLGECFDPETNTWDRLPQMPEHHVCGAAAVLTCGQ
eukprot:NODE_5417_length_1773_cov_5.162819.p1 GENE.NODE_5417_length_1773_cov_5.162819~~NODE_5417_length_1773_cov_5.162819.p1  ORF type:complete len:402 (-),score=107.53 NODE_5417_length_1773_cov_5.162819:436-1641(-)